MSPLYSNTFYLEETGSWKLCPGSSGGGGTEEDEGEAVFCDGQPVPPPAGHHHSTGQLPVSDQLTQAEGLRERYHRSFLPAAVRLFNQLCSQ